MAPELLMAVAGGCGYGCGVESFHFPATTVFPKQKQHRSDFPLFKPKAQNHRIKVANTLF